MEKYLQKLEERKANGLFRSLSSFSLEDYTDFYSNNYLGFADLEFESDLDYVSATGSRLISGNSEIYDSCENYLAEFFEADAALIFNSGYDANLGLLSSLPQKGDTVIYDELVHASIRDGIRLSHAKAFKFQHNSILDLEKKLQKTEGEVFVVAESVYSMDGDFSPLEGLVQLCKKYNAKLIVDEAHAAGVFGAGGRGLSVKHNLVDDLFARVVTFGKAYGAHGAIVLGSKELKEYLVNFARSFIYTTGLPNHSIERIQQVVHQSRYENELRVKLKENIQYFKQMFAESAQYQISSDSPIQTLIFPGNSEVKKIEERLLKEGILCKGILSPTVPEGKERLRISIHSFNTEGEIKKLHRLITS